MHQQHSAKTGSIEEGITIISTELTVVTDSTTSGTTATGKTDTGPTG